MLTPILPGMDLLDRLAARHVQRGGDPAVEMLSTNIRRAQGLAQEIQREADEFSAGPLNHAAEGTEQWFERLARVIELRRQLYVCTSAAIEAARRLEASAK